MITEISIKWCIEDVIYQAKEDEVDITKEQASEVLQLLDKQHDCNYGITWETISVAIQTVVNDR